MVIFLAALQSIDKSLYEAAAIDGPEAESALRYCADNGLRLTTILNTHTHPDHIGLNRDLARQQIEGGLIYGLSLALGSAIGFEGGLPTNSRLARLNLPTLAESPEIAIDFVTSDAEPFDPGELGTVIAPPAIANAMSSATGRRFRSLPLDIASAQPS